MSSSSFSQTYSGMWFVKLNQHLHLVLGVQAAYHQSKMNIRDQHKRKLLFCCVISFSGIKSYSQSSTKLKQLNVFNTKGHCIKFRAEKATVVVEILKCLIRTSCTCGKKKHSSISQIDYRLNSNPHTHLEKTANASI